MTQLTIRATRALGRAVHSAGLAGPLPWPSGCDFVTTRYTLQHQLAAQCTWVSRRPLYVTYVTRDRATGHGVGYDDDWSRISHLGSSESVGHERSAAVQLSRQTPARASQIQVRRRVLRKRVCTEYRGQDAGDLGTDGGDHATVLTDGFHANWPSRGPTRCLSATSNGAADGTVSSLDAQGFRMGSSVTRYRRSIIIASSGSMRLVEQPQYPERNGRTSQESRRRLRWKWASSPSRARGLAPRRSALLCRCGRGSGTPARHTTAPHVVRRGMSGRPSGERSRREREESGEGVQTEK